VSKRHFLPIFKKLKLKIIEWDYVMFHRKYLFRKVEAGCSTADSGYNPCSSSNFTTSVLQVASRNNNNVHYGLSKNAVVVDSSILLDSSNNNANNRDAASSRQSFRIAMGNPCEFFVDTM